MTMSFPYAVEVACLMSLAIRANKVEYIAIVLFGAHIEIKDGVRCLVLENRAKNYPRPEMSPQGAQPDGITILLGRDVFRAVARSLTRKEVEEKYLTTSSHTPSPKYLPRAPYY